MSSLEELGKSKAEMDSVMHSGNAHDVVQGIATFASVLSEIMDAADARKREAARIKRNTRARARYAAQKANGTLPKDKRAKAAREAELDRLEEAIYMSENAHRCRCMDPGAMPPCGHCEGCGDCAEED